MNTIVISTFAAGLKCGIMKVTRGRKFLLFYREQIVFSLISGTFFGILNSFVYTAAVLYMY